MSSHVNGWYPVMLRLAGKRCIVVGGGPVAERKVLSLLEAGADEIVVISDQMTESLERWGEEGGIRLIHRLYREGDLAGSSLVIAATNDPAVNTAIAAEAERLRIWVNIASDGESGTMITPAVVRKGELIVALSTGGASPALAAKLRTELEQLLGDDYEPRLRALRMLRERLLGMRRYGYSGEVGNPPFDDSAMRRKLLRAAAEDELGWRTVAALLPDSLYNEEQSEINYTIELCEELDRWIERLKTQQT
ncbi:precorrin-2 dehydrogenase/sirohydrochlorin ferrochelatase family protein [Paenibacillus xylaniclasticus]|uniref:precorrin-2 dehydrogenase/sirohydrochlorin ferrochelatase family protein n=1 Tax=Paenibacillus xylaniclasticus TaxID=588083 RepID=UPI000FD713AD|nr:MULTISPECIES: bifunctional precorrin-2 dehydrogenase/sirohydrochlorin ferrochelatase [Paenibacillus]GFN33650.1 hypothetical protein PCURB6_39100 [Paenibacillus curdlanolyticus]